MTVPVDELSVVEQAPRPSPLQVAARWGLTALLLYLVFGVLLPQFASYADIWDALTSLTGTELAVLGVLFVALELLKPATNALLVPGLGLRRAQASDAAASAISSTVPGPSGTAARLLFYRQYGVSTEDFGRATVVNSLANNSVALLAPIVGVVLLATQQDVRTSTWTLALVGLGIAAVGGALVASVLRSEAFARWFGVRLQRVVTWALGVVRRRPPRSVEQAVVRFRTDTLDVLGRAWPSLTAIVTARYLTTLAVLIVAVRALGADRGALSLVELFAVYALVQMVCIVQLTPGGVGVTEALYVAALAAVADGTQQGLLVGAVLVFRVVTYAMPIALGAVCYLVVTRDRRRAERAGSAAQELGGPRPVLRVLVVWLSTAAALDITGWLLPGMTMSSVGGALAAAAVLGVLNAVLWPLVVWLALPLTVLTLGLAPLLLNGAMVGLVAWLLDSVAIDSLGTGIAAAVGVTLVNSLVTAVLSIDDDEVYHRGVARRARRRAPATDVPGVLFLQIDGLGHAVLRRALRDGDAPTLASWIDRGSHRLLPWETDWSSQTGASQAGILLGSNQDMPAFRWLEKDTGRLLVSNSPRWAGVLEAERDAGCGLLRADGASRGNIFTGGAGDAVLTMAVAGRKRGRIGSPYFTYFAHPYNGMRTALVSVGEVLREIRQAAAQRRRDVRPRVSRGGVYPFLRAFTTVIARDVTVSTLIGDLYAGRSVVYADFLGYDEVAHHSGVERHEALDTLRRLDRELGRLERAAAGAPRPYRIVVLSDHGQSQGTTFETRYGQTLGDVVRAAMAAPVTEQVTGDEAWGYAGGVVEEMASGQGATARALRRLSRSRRTADGIALGPARQEAAPSDGDAAVVLASGCLGLVHLTADPSRMTLERITDRYPELVPALVEHPGIGFLLVRSEREGAVVLGRDGAHVLATGEVRGVDPLADYGPSAPRQVARTDGFAHCADIMVNGAWDPQTDEVGAFEPLVGSHGGLGGEQTRPFILYPADLPVPHEPLHGAEAVHRLFVSWLAHLGQPAYAAAQVEQVDLPAQRETVGVATTGPG
jgi:uncharacterized protein (TIRG00374 family)